MSTRTIGDSTLVSTDRTAKTLARMLRAKARATEAMAEEARTQAQEVYFTDGDGQWAPNAPGTIAWKGFDGPMRGRTATLSRDIRIQPSEANPGAKSVGWFEDPHPDTQGRLSTGAVATEHEHGNSNEPPRPWISKVHDNPSREEAVMTKGKAAYSAGV